jgi:hypothetical protein
MNRRRPPSGRTNPPTVVVSRHSHGQREALEADPAKLITAAHVPGRQPPTTAAAVR